MALILPFIQFKHETTLMYCQLERWQKQKALDRIRKKYDCSIIEAVHIAQNNCLFECYKLQVKCNFNRSPLEMIAI